MYLFLGKQFYWQTVFSLLRVNASIDWISCCGPKSNYFKMLVNVGGPGMEIQWETAHLRVRGRWSHSTEGPRVQKTKQAASSRWPVGSWNVGSVSPQKWPQDWKRSVFIPIPNKGNAKEYSNYHTIALISRARKVMHTRQHTKKQRHYFANKGPTSQSYGFSSSHVWM